jgi:hypothetical protein
VANLLLIAFVLPESLNFRLDSVRSAAAAQTPGAAAEGPLLAPSSPPDSESSGSTAVGAEEYSNLRPVSAAADEEEIAEGATREVSLLDGWKYMMQSPVRARRAASRPDGLSGVTILTLRLAWSLQVLRTLAFMELLSSMAENGIIETINLYLKDRCVLCRASSGTRLEANAAPSFLSGSTSPSTRFRRRSLWPVCPTWWSCLPSTRSSCVVSHTVPSLALLWQSMPFASPCKCEQACAAEWALTVAMFRLVPRSYSTVNKPWQSYAMESLTGISFLGYPTASALISRLCKPHEKGLAQGALSGVRGLTSGLGPLVFSGTFSFFTSKYAPFDFPQAPFIVAAVLLAVSFVFALRLPAGESDFSRSKSASEPQR